MAKKSYLLISYILELV